MLVRKFLFRNQQTFHNPILYFCYSSSPFCVENFISRSRLSLDLNSPSMVELPRLSTTPTAAPAPKLYQNLVHSHSNISLHTIITTPTTPNANPTNNVFSTRYTEFKTYSSTFDGLQALENHNGTNASMNGINSNNNSLKSRVIPSAIGQEMPLMRVASLPAMTPPQIPGKFYKFT